MQKRKNSNFISPKKEITSRLPAAKKSNEVRVELLKAAITIQQHSKTNKLSTLELERFNRDLNLLIRRLKSREYRQTSFQPRNMLTIPDRTEEIFQDLLFFWSVGRLWHDLFKNLKISDKAKILDFACGFFPKVELGLYYIGFMGTVTLLDQSKTALAYAQKFLMFFRVQFRIKTAAHSIWKISTKQKFDVIAANHSLDDILLSEFCSRNKISINKAYSDESIFAQCWEKIFRESNLINELAPKLAQKFDSITNIHGLIILADYPGFSHRSLKMRKLINYVYKFQSALKVELKKLKYTEISPCRENEISYDRLKVCSHDILCLKKL